MSVIAISLNNTFLELSDNSIRWEAVNTLFEDNALQGDYSFPFTLPYSPTNMNALGFAHKAEVFTQSVTYQVVLFLGPRSIPSKLIINGCKANGYSVNIAGGIKGISNASKNLRDLDLGTRDLAEGFGNMALYQYVNWQLGIAFPPHYNPGFYGAANATFNGVINRQDATTGAFKYNTVDTGNKYCFVPFVYLFYILKAIFEDIGLAPSGTFWNDKELATALIYNNYALDKAEDIGVVVKSNIAQHLVFPMHDSLGADPITIKLYNDLSGCSDEGSNWNNATSKYIIPQDASYACKFTGRISYNGGYAIKIIISAGGSNIGSFDAMPVDEEAIDINIIAALPSGISASEIYVYSYSLSGDNDDDGHSDASDFMIENCTLTIYQYDHDEFNIMDQTVTISKHLPNMDVQTFLKGVKNRFQTSMDIDWDNKLVVMNLAERTIIDPAEVNLTDEADPNYEIVFGDINKGYSLNYDFGSSDTLVGPSNFVPLDTTRIIATVDKPADLPTPINIDDLAIVKNKNKVARVIDDSGLIWVDYMDYYYPVIVGNAEREIKMELAPMMMTDQQLNESATENANHKKCLMPAITEMGSSILFGIGSDNSPSFRMVFMRGVNSDHTIGGYYIYASSTNIDINGNSVGNYTSMLQGPNGWYITFLEKILLAINTDSIFEHLVMLPITYLRYKGKVQIKNVNYIIKSISMPIGINVKQSLMKLLKLQY